MVESRESDYRAAGFAGELGYGRRPALVVVDMVMSYFDPSSPMYAGVENVLDSNISILEVAHAKRVPVFFTRQIYDATGEDAYVRKVPALKLLRPGSPLAELHPKLPIGDAKVIVKRYPSAFHGTELARDLAELGVDTLLITGLTTSGCVRATAMDCLLHNLAGIVVREAVGDRDRRAHEANLFDINSKLADVRGAAEVVSWLGSLRDAQ